MGADYTLVFITYLYTHTIHMIKFLGFMYYKTPVIVYVSCDMYVINFIVYFAFCV